MEKISQSPLPPQAQSPSGNKEENKENKEELFDFPTAMKRVAEGKRISKKEWKSNNIYGEMKDERLMLHKEDDKHSAWIVSLGDLEGNDWFIVE